MLKNIILFIFLIGIVSCSNYQAGYASKMIQIATDLELTDIVFVNQDTGFVSGGNIFGDGIFFRTNDGGLTWDTAQTTPKGINSLDYSNGQLSFSQSGQKLHRSYNLNTWNQGFAYGWWAWHSHVKLTNGNAILVGGENFGRGFVHIQTFPQPQLIRTDSFEHELRDISYINNTLYVVGYGLGIKSTDEGLTWQKMNLTGDFFRGIDFPSASVGYVVGEYGSVHKTTDGGEKWKQVRVGNSLFANSNKRFMDIAFADDNLGFLVGTDNMVWQTTNGGKVWKEIKDLDGWGNFSAIRIQNNKAYITADQGQLLIIDL